MENGIFEWKVLLPADQQLPNVSLFASSQIQSSSNLVILQSSPLLDDLVNEIDPPSASTSSAAFQGSDLPVVRFARTGRYVDYPLNLSIR